jgi:hypothetical protein
MPHDTLAKLVFLHLMGSVGHAVHSGASGERNVDSLFFLLEWDWYGFDKKRIGTRYTELVFLHLVGCMGHIVHSGLFGMRNGDTLLFLLGWDSCGFDIKHDET